MINRRTACKLALAPALALLDSRQILAQQSSTASMQIVDIGLPDGASEVIPVSLNANGNVMVTARVDDVPATFIYRDNAFHRIGSTELAVTGVALNDNGAAVGWASEEEEKSAAVLIGDDNLVTMPGDFQQSRALAINLEGVIAGTASVDGEGDALKPCYWTESSIEILPAIGGDGGGSVLALNTILQMVGTSSSEDADATSHATLWFNGEATDLGTLGGNLSEARGINETGLIVGSSLTTAEQNTYQEAGVLAFRWLDGQLNELRLGPDHIWGNAHDVNDVGMIVGVAGLAATGAHGNTTVAILWSDDEALDLNSIATGDDGFTLTDAVSVNAFGQILCKAVDADNNTRIAVLSVIGN